MLYLALALFIFALFFFRQSSVQRKEAGLPGGRIIYSDTRGWGKVEKPLFYTALELTGKPDYLVQQNGRIIPVEVKSGRIGDAPYDSHIYQLAAYCLLVQRSLGVRPPNGILHYSNRTFISSRHIVCWWRKPIKRVHHMGSFIMKTVILQ